MQSFLSWRGSILLTILLAIIVQPSKSINFSSERWGVDNAPQILVTGGAGYIGSHTVLLLLEAGYECTVVDSLVNSSPESLNRVGNLTGLGHRLHFAALDLRDREGLRSLLHAMRLQGATVEAVIHFAGLKAVGESVREPLEYYDANVASTLVLLQEMERSSSSSPLTTRPAVKKRLIFSSSATVYGSFAVAPLTEASPAGAGITNPYGRTKYVIEEMLGDLTKATPKASAPAKPSAAADTEKEGGGGDGGDGDGWDVVILRYFNPVGAHPSGLIGEDPSGPPNNLMPFVAQVAVGRREVVRVFGDDYDTPDGTGVRDYIHVMDLAEGHVAALKQLLNKNTTPSTSSFQVFNLGSGLGYSVLDMVAAMKEACGCEVPYTVSARRSGDLATVYADTAKAERELGWKATRSLGDMCADLWRWQQNNPKGYPPNARFFRDGGSLAEGVVKPSWWRGAARLVSAPIGNLLNKALSMVKTLPAGGGGRRPPRQDGNTTEPRKLEL